MNFQELFRRLFAENGLSCTAPEKFESLYNLLVEGNDLLNLTALTSAESVIVRHFADCVRIAGFIQKDGHVIDVGCGGGFPSLPLAIVRPDVKILALDATEKKARFVCDCAAALGLQNVRVVCGRAEILARQDFRQTFDAAVSRAVARLNVLAELCLPLVRIGGLFLAMKGASADEEVIEAQRGIAELGGKITRTDSFLLSDGSVRSNLLITKISNTPQRYPRNYARIKKNPVGI